MSGLFDALLLGGLASLVAGALIWWVLSRFAMRPQDVGIWRLARWASLAPLLIAPLIYAMPQAVPATGSGLAAAHPVLASPLPFSATGQPVAPPEPFVVDTRWLLALYLIGLTIALAAALLRHVRRHSILAGSRLPDPRERRQMARAGLADLPPVRVSGDLASPVLTGWNGIVLVPETLFEDADFLRFALLHEQTHQVRGDERDRLVGSALTTVLWFHLPLRWIERDLGAARELACDAQVLDTLGSAQRPAYAATLIRSMQRATPAASAFGPQDRRHRFMRLKAILDAGQGSRLRTGLLAMATALIIGPVGLAQAAWTDRHTPLAEVDRVAPIQTPQPAPEPRAEPRELPFGEPAPMSAPTPAAAPSPESAPAPPEASFGPPEAPEPFVAAPVTGGRLTSRYGPRPAQPADAPRFHNGTDIAASPGTPVRAPAAGRVVHAAYGFDGNEAWGNTIAIDHGNGWQSVYGHLQGLDVSAGDVVAAGDQIGRVGSTGRSTGPHVHIEVRRNGARLDPEAHMPGLR